MADKQNAGDVTEKAGTRYNVGKNQLALISPMALWAIGEVYTMGAQKYADRNWEKGLSYTETLDALLRHVVKFMAGHELDEESGLHHMAHAAWNAITLLHFTLQPEMYAKFDDRSKTSLGVPNTAQTQGASNTKSRDVERVVRVAGWPIKLGPAKTYGERQPKTQGDCT